MEREKVVTVKARTDGWRASIEVTRNPATEERWGPLKTLVVWLLLGAASWALLVGLFLL
jgi:hypothetical protein